MLNVPLYAGEVGKGQGQTKSNGNTKFHNSSMFVKGYTLIRDTITTRLV